jgi:hypothetical protein
MVFDGHDVVAIDLKIFDHEKQTIKFGHSLLSLLNNFNRVDIQIIGWFVQNQKVYVLQEHFGKGNLDSFSPTQTLTCLNTSSRLKSNLARNIGARFLCKCCLPLHFQG